jgi:hypothetical protein
MAGIDYLRQDLRGGPDLNRIRKGLDHLRRVSKRYGYLINRRALPDVCGSAP